MKNQKGEDQRFFFTMCKKNVLVDEGFPYKMFSVSVTHSKLFNGAGNKTLFASNFISYLQPNAGSQASPLQGQWRVTVAGEGPLRYQRKGLLANDTISKGKFARKKLANKTVH